MFNRDEEDEESVIMVVEEEDEHEEGEEDEIENDKDIDGEMASGGEVPPADAAPILGVV